ncbi:caspase family protein [Lewinella sp. LCG006]|uniref:caspase family protein n=1 Tax=Lewinella sp. LCG006 TaxID=3231911 RepID=UPI00345F9873
MNSLSKLSSNYLRALPATSSKQASEIGFTLLILAFFFASFSLTAQSTTRLLVPSGHVKDISQVVISPDGRLVASGSFDQSCKIYDLPTGRELLSLPTESNIRALSFSADSRYLAVAAYYRLYIIDIQQLKVVREIKTWQNYSLAYHPTQPYLYYTTRKDHNYNVDPPVEFWRLDSPTATPQSTGSYQQKGTSTLVTAAISFSSDQNQLLLALMDGNGVLLNLSTKSTQLLAGARTFLPNGNLFYASIANQQLTMAAKTLTGQKVWEKIVPASDLEPSLINAFVSRIGFLPAQELFYWVPKKGSMVTGNYRTGELGMRTMPDILGTVLAAGAGQQLVAATNAPYQLVHYSLPDLAVLKYIGEPTIRPYSINTAASLQQAGIIASRGKALLLTLGKPSIQITPVQKAVGGNTAALSPDGRFMVSANEFSDFLFWVDLSGDRIPRSIKLSFKNVRGLSFSADGRRLAVVGHNGAGVYDTQNKTWLFTKNLPAPDFYQEQFAFSADGQQLVLTQRGTDQGQAPKLINYHVATGQVNWEQPSLYFGQLAFTPDGQGLFAAQSVPFRLHQLDAKTGRSLTAKAVAGVELVGKYAYNTERQLLAITDAERKKIHLIDTRSASQTRTLQLSSPRSGDFAYLDFIGDDFLLTAGIDNRTHLWDARSGQLVGSLILYETNNDWALVTPDGRFDGSSGAIAKMSYAIGQKVIPLEQLYEGFFTPGLARQLLGRATSPTPPVIIDRIQEPPSISIRYHEGTRNLVVEDDEAIEQISTQAENATLQLTASAPGDRVTEIRLFHNGKLVSQGQRNLLVEDDVPTNNQKTFQVKLLPGENIFSAVAVNSQRTESAAARLQVNYSPVQQQTIAPAQGITLHLLTIGINQYKNPRYNLNYAAADAESFRAALVKGMMPITSQVKTYQLSDAQADRANIITILEQVQQAARPQDIFVFYYAGHGVMNEGAQKDFYLVPYDVTQLYGNDEALAQRGISAHEMKALAAKIAAQKQLYILDACQSAGALEALATRGAAEEKAIAQLARATGTHWLTSSGSEQFATEFDQLGHGVFTYALLQGLSGKADSGDGRVTVNELKAYLETQVPELTQQYRGLPQYPASYGFGQDFPLGVWR